jgi:prepilin-type N-terminal cleavage/methylation domain-containing protein
LFKNNKEAFTLVELAIVIVIIGLLVGGVLQGQELIKQAKVRSQIKQLLNIEAQTETFRAKYNCLPGDCLKATMFFGATDKNGNTVRDGDGDQLIRSTVGADTPYANDNCTQGGVYNSELPQFWLQLNNAGIGSYTSDGISNTLGRGYPASAVESRVGVMVTCLQKTGSEQALNPNLRKGNVIGIGFHRNGTNNTNRIAYISGVSVWDTHAESNQTGIFSDIVRSIDDKIDDGLPLTGIFGVVGSSPTLCPIATNVYPVDECKVTAGRKM